MIQNAIDGLKFEPGTMLYRINNHSKLWLLADIYENDLPFIQLGQKAEFEIEGRPGEMYEGTVDFIPPMVNSETRTIPVRIKVPNPEFKLKMNQYGEVSFRENLGEILSVHREAVLITGKRAVVFKEIEEGRFKPVEVHLGRIADDYYEVLHGLKDGDRVVTNGRFWLDAESRLQGAGAVPMMEHQH
jgi:Cu(I)/Ag(I) efflux system membrane fusion protein